MQNKDLIKNNFTKCIATYDNQATVQKQMAKKLAKLVKEYGTKSFDKVLEIGVGTGLLTAELTKTIDYKQYFANDIISNYHQYAKDNDANVVCVDGDIEHINLQSNYDLIIANAVFQWVDDLEGLIKKLIGSLAPNGLLVFSTFADNNFPEIEEVFSVKLDSYSKEQLAQLMEKHSKLLHIERQQNVLWFEDCFQVLGHIRDTGTNNLVQGEFSSKKTRECCQAYDNKYKTEQGVSLTYEPVYVACGLRNLGYD